MEDGTRLWSKEAETHRKLRHGQTGISGEHLWDRLGEETEYAWKGFCIYRDMGPGRTILGCAQVLGMPEVSRGNIYLWIEKYHWRERIAAWDQEVTRQHLQSEIQAKEDVDKRHRKLSLRLYQILAQRLVGDPTAGIQPLDPNRIGPGEWVRMMELAVRVERLAHGMELDRRTNRNQEQVDVEVKVGIEKGTFDSVAANLAYQFLERVNQFGEAGSAEVIDMPALPPASEASVKSRPAKVVPEEDLDPRPQGVCAKCGEPFTQAKVGRPRKFCTNCDSRARGAKPRGRPKVEPLKCQVCGKPLTGQNRRFCSPEHHREAQHADWNLHQRMVIERAAEDKILGPL
jgi:hypothetical protein